jgi:hypothetical protein
LGQTIKPLQPIKPISTFTKKIVEKRADAASEPAVGEIQNHKRQREYPKEANGESQEKVKEPQRQQAGEEGNDWIFN